MRTTTRPKVGVSYSWKEETDGPNKAAVDSFCQQLRDAGVEVIRDKDRVKHGESLSAFMRDLGAMDHLCVFLSEPYLKSPNCMYELLVSWQRSKDAPAEFRSRVSVWVMSGTRIRSIEDRLAVTDHWFNEKERIEPLIQRYVMRGMAGRELDLYRRQLEIALAVNDILSFVADTLSPRSVDEFQAWVRQQFPSGNTGHDPLILVAEEIERVLSTNAAVRDFLLRVAPELLAHGGTALSEAFRDRSLDLGDAISGIRQQLDSFNAPAQEWRVLGDFLGGLVLFGLKPDWLRQNNAAARTHASDVSAYGETVRVDGRNVNFLHLVAQALSAGLARLEHVFGELKEDPKRMRELAVVGRGITTADQRHEMKRHFIRCVLGPEPSLEGVSVQRVDKLFEDVQRVLTSALNDDRAGFFATSPRYREFVPLIREDLKLEDLLLLLPTGEDTASEEAIFPDHIRVLRLLGQIFDRIQAKTK